MMSYEEMTHSVLEKVKLRKAARKRRNRYIAYVAGGLCCTLLIIGVGCLPDNPADSVISGQTDPTIESTGALPNSDKAARPRITLLTATPGVESEMQMPFNIEVPYKAEIRVHNISGLTENELQQIISEERAYVRKIAEESGLNYSYSPSIRENVCITTMSLGCFVLRFADSEQVERVRAAVTDNGRLHIIPWVDGCSNSAYGRMSIVDIDGEHLRSVVSDDKSVDLQMYWHSSVEIADKIDTMPDLDLSCISDAITILVDYTDGREEMATVYIRVDSKGQVSAILAEPFSVQYPGIGQ